VGVFHKSKPVPLLWKSPALLRRRWYAAPGRQHRLRQPVISVGNLSHGGRGKTPVVALLARMLVEAGERPAILTRGYARRLPADGVVVVSDGAHLLADLDRSGDEPLMLARDLPGARVLVCAQRALAGALAERVLGATVHLLDDGFQHVQLARDVDLVVVGPEDLDERRGTFGRLREPVEALAAADGIVMDAWSPGSSDPGLPGPEGPGLHRANGWFTLVRSVDQPVPLEPARGWDAPNRRVVAVAGIARPQRFVDLLRAEGWEVVESLAFGDHHPYTPADLSRIAEAASRTGAPVLTTAKDAVRLLPHRPLPVSIALVPLQVSIEPAGAFAGWLFERLREARA
jgi:tetraacyldisaccharide 4'-kinase